VTLCTNGFLAVADGGVGKGTAGYFRTGGQMITIRKKRHFCLQLFLTLVLLGLPALAQTQFSGQITVNVVGSSATLANPVYYNETINQVTVSTTGALSCAAYPQVTLFRHCFCSPGRQLMQLAEAHK
jgi:hypothetical protein